MRQLSFVCASGRFWKPITIIRIPIPPASIKEISAYLLLLLTLLKATDKHSDDRSMNTLLQTVSMKALKFS